MSIEREIQTLSDAAAFRALEEDMRESFARRLELIGLGFDTYDELRSWVDEYRGGRGESSSS